MLPPKSIFTRFQPPPEPKLADYINLGKYSLMAAEKGCSFSSFFALSGVVDLRVIFFQQTATETFSFFLYRKDSTFPLLLLDSRKCLLERLLRDPADPSSHLGIFALSTLPLMNGTSFESL